MFKYKTIGIFLVVSTMFSACTDWLTTVPETGVIVQDFWQSKEDVNAAAIACYQSMQNDVTTNMFLWGELRGDMVTYMDNCPIRYQLILEGEIKPDNDLVEWGDFYSTINLCNTLIEFAPQVLALDESLSEEELNGYLAEAYTLRALMYFYLARTFGAVPLITTSSSTDNQNFSVPKSEMSVILGQIKEDLLVAEQGAVASYSSNAQNKGRITKYAVKAIMADVYLWTEEPELSLKACNEIINSGQFGLVFGDNVWFSTLYGVGNSAEGIFELQFDQNKLNPFFRMFHQQRGRQLTSAPVVYESMFILDENVDPDSIDIRGDNASFKSTRSNIFWKYMGWDASRGREDYESYANYMLYRYADVLLLKAEALAHLGRGAEALSLIYQVRERAKASKISDEKPSSEDKNAILRFILSERTREFAFEGKRWYDVLRVSRYNNYENLEILIEMVKFAALPDKQQSVVSKHRDVNYHYFPIHQDELNVNPNLEQNEFYIDQN